MIVKHFKPCPILQEFVRSYFLVHFVFEKGSVVPIKPLAAIPESGITFFVKGSAIIANQITGQNIKAPPVSIFGQYVSRHNVTHLSNEYLMLRVLFQPGAFYRLLEIPLSEFTDQYADATAAINREVEDINNRLAECADYAQMLQVVEFYLLGKTKRIKKECTGIDKIAAQILADPSKFSLDYFAKEACLSPRQFNRRFTERIGVGPKLYSRIVRFDNAFRYKEKNPHTNWLEVATLFDYTDYQHLARDFREFAGVNPNFWINEINCSPEKILGLG
jgi:AraC-like DNA-binding protein